MTRKRPWLASFVCVTATIAAAAGAIAQPVDTPASCSVTVSKRSYLKDSACSVKLWPGNSGFTLTAETLTAGTLKVDVSGGGAVSAWNVPERTKPGQKLIGLDGKPVALGRVTGSPLGRLKRSGKSRNCWSNARTKVCVSPAPDLD